MARMFDGRKNFWRALGVRRHPKKSPSLLQERIIHGCEQRAGQPGHGMEGLRRYWSYAYRTGRIDCEFHTVLRISYDE